MEIKRETVKINNSDIPVTIHIPDNVSDTVRQQKINLLYDLLKPKEETPEKDKNIA